LDQWFLHDRVPSSDAFVTVREFLAEMRHSRLWISQYGCPQTFHWPPSLTNRNVWSSTEPLFSVSRARTVPETAPFVLSRLNPVTWWLTTFGWLFTAWVKASLVRSRFASAHSSP